MFPQEQEADLAGKSNTTMNQSPRSWADVVDPLEVLVRTVDEIHSTSDKGIELTCPRYARSVYPRAHLFA
jgi:hypothetical protein